MEECKKYIILVGNCRAGKTTFVNRIITGDFTKIYLSTIGFDLKKKVIKVDEHNYNIYFLDTSGINIRNNFSVLTNHINTNGIIYMYDIADRESFDSIPEWIENTKDMIKDKKNCSMFMIGSKLDLEEKRIVTEEEGRKFAEQNGMHFLELSSTDKESVNKSMLFIIKKILNLSDDFSGKIMMGSKNINEKENEKQDHCCCEKEKENEKQGRSCCLII